eukprot:scaffold2829_cov261-Chaetoceros_neogracile.AAC.1
MRINAAVSYSMDFRERFSLLFFFTFSSFLHHGYDNRLDSSADSETADSRKKNQNVPTYTDTSSRAF